MDIDEIKRLDQLHVMHSWSVNKSRDPLVPYNAKGKEALPSKEITKRLLQNGLYTPMRWMFLSISPPLSISEDELRQGLAIIDDVLGYADSLTLC